MRKKPIVPPVASKGFRLAVGRDVDPQELGRQLRRLRELAGEPIGLQAERMDWKPQNVSRLERGDGKREPMISSINRYVRMLGYELVLVVQPPKRSLRASRKRAPGPEGEGSGTA